MCTYECACTRTQLRTRPAHEPTQRERGTKRSAPSARFFSSSMSDSGICHAFCCRLSRSALSFRTCLSSSSCRSSALFARSRSRLRILTVMMRRSTHSPVNDAATAIMSRLESALALQTISVVWLVDDMKQLMHHWDAVSINLVTAQETAQLGAEVLARRNAMMLECMCDRACLRDIYCAKEVTSDSLPGSG